MKDNYIKDVKAGRLKRFSAFLADREWNAAGGVSMMGYCTFTVICCFLQITLADFLMYELLDQHIMFEPTILDEFPNLKVKQ